jgi:hypothetical protein
MELRIKVSIENCGAYGENHKLYVGNCEGVRYEFDPLKAALKDCGIQEISGETNRMVAKKHLEYIKTAVIRARSGALLRYISSKSRDLTDDEFTALWSSTWEAR